MPDNILLNVGVGGETIATDDIGGIQHELVKLEFGTDGNATMVSASDPLPVVVASALPAGTNVIGHVIADTGSTTAVTGNVTVVQGTGTNLHAVLDASSAVIGHVINDAGSAIIGKVGIDQTTPGTTNLVALTAETTKVIGTINIAAAQTLATVTTVGAVTAITNALPAGTALLGKTGIDQTTPGTTNNVTTKDLPDASSTYALTNVSSTAYEASHVLKGSSGYLFMVTGYNSKTSTQFIQLHNSATVPADTAVPVLIFAVSASSNFSLDLGKYGRYFSTGIAICNSSTGPTKTVGTTDCFFDAQVI